MINDLIITGFMRLLLLNSINLLNVFLKGVHIQARKIKKIEVYFL